MCRETGHVAWTHQARMTKNIAQNHHNVQGNIISLSLGRGDALTSKIITCKTVRQLKEKY